MQSIAGIAAECHPRCDAASAGFAPADRLRQAMFRLSRPEKVHGLVIPAPRFTALALRRMLVWGLLPFLALCLVGDVVLYLIFRYVFGSCYGLLCLFG